MSALEIGTFFGIPVKVHWTFNLLILFIVGMGLYKGMNTEELVGYLVFVLCLFLCVILHEYGHAIAARRYGVKTVDIIISPIGGLARLERLPKKPLQELVVAIAGPLVNVVLGLLIMGGVLIAYNDTSVFNVRTENEALTTLSGFFVMLIYANAALFFFNLIPAFPMDGGRILRALLSMKLGRIQATKIASYIGRGLAVILMLLAFYTGNYMLIIIGVFVFTMARAEYINVNTEEVLTSISAGDVMRTDFTRLHLSDTLQTAYNIVFRRGEKSFVVFDSMGNPSGTLGSFHLSKANKENNLHLYVSQMMSKVIVSAPPERKLIDIFNAMNKQGAVLTIIRDENDEIIGTIDRDIITRVVKMKGGAMA